MHGKEIQVCDLPKKDANIFWFYGLCFILHVSCFMFEKIYFMRLKK